MRAHPVEEVVELGADGLDVAERDARRDEGDELAIRGVRVAVNDADRVRVTPDADVAAGAHRVERRLHPYLAPAQGTARTKLQFSIHWPPRDGGRGGSLAALCSAPSRWVRA